MGKNTAPCIGVAAVFLRRLGGNAPMLVLPADHIIEPTEAFDRYVRAAVSCIETHGGLLTFGIRPTRPETGYGYIQAGERIFTAGDAEVFRAEAFHEKPVVEMAERFLEAGTYFWNSGMFLWKIGDILQAFAEHIPELYSVLSRIEKKIDSENIERVLESLYPQAPSISIDYGVMEKANDVVVLRADLSWNDVGSWESLRDIYGADERGNVVLGEHVFIDSSDNTVFSPERLVGMVGAENLVVVDAGDSILVCRRERTQDVRKVVEYLKEHGREDLV
jgi:mannose-1-phosphate guanylyltransferase